LTLVQFRVMAFLYRQRDCSLSELAGHLGVTRSTASALIDRFVRRGWATRTINRNNRRQVMLRLTRRGAEQFEVAKRAARRDALRRLAALAPAQLETLAQCLDALANAFGDGRR
jgi:DNA-binding MarR family transcriptional regulator